VANETPTVDDLKIIYQEIIKGFSFVPDNSFIVKHLTEIEQIDILRFQRDRLQFHLKEGIPAEKERLQQIIDDEQWNQDQEDEITSLRLTIIDNEKNLKMFVIPSQQEMVRKAIERDKQKMLTLIARKHDILGVTADELSRRDALAYQLVISTFLDPKLTQPKFQKIDDLDELDAEEYQTVVTQLEEALTKFSDYNIRLISVMPFFLNVFSYSREHITDFLRKPSVDFTSYQTQLFSLGQRTLHILGQTEGSAPELGEGGSLDDILTWYDRQYSVILGKRNSGK